MIPLPQKLIDALRQLDARKSALVEGWLLGQDLPPGNWSLLPDFSAIVSQNDDPPPNP